MNSNHERNLRSNARRSPIQLAGSTAGLHGAFIAGWTRPRPRATPLRRRSARAAPPWHSRRAQRAHATDRGCRAQCGRSNDLLLTRSNELPPILDSTITIAHIRSQSTHRNDCVHAHAAMLGAPRTHALRHAHYTRRPRTRASRTHVPATHTHVLGLFLTNDA